VPGLRHGRIHHPEEEARVTLAEAHQLLIAAKCPEDVFGDLAGGVAWRFRELAKITHSDLYTKVKDKAAADEAFKALNIWRDRAAKKITAGTYGDRTAMEEVVLATKTAKYTLYRRLAGGDKTNLYAARGKDGAEVVVKIVRSPANNPLMETERDRLVYLRDDAPTKKLKAMAHIPVLVDSFELGGKVKRRANVLQRPGATETGVARHVTLADVIKAFPSGIDLRDAAWMFNRLCGALLIAHQAKIIHGAVLPQHVLICPETHNALLIDWAYAIKRGETLKYIVPAQKLFYPPEVFEKRPLGLGVDLYMAAKCLFALVPKADIPSNVRGILNACLLGAKARTPDIWELYAEFNDMLKALYGPRKFRKFVMP